MSAEPVSKRKQNWILALALLLVLVGSLVASATQTNGWTVKVKDVRWVGSNGKIMSALLYIPPNVYGKDEKGALKINPAPAVVAIHGYINSRETQSAFAIEYARRGYVVLAADQSGHGYSDPPALGAGFGGPDSLAYLRTLNIVDKDNIALSGHSMGGWASVVAAGVYPDGYKSIILEGSSTGTYGGKEGDAKFPRNLGLIFSKYDEFSALMWLVPVPANIGQGDKMKKQFGTTEPVEVGKLYGSIADGTARMWYQPNTNHPGDHISTEAVGYAIDWLQKTLKGGNGLPPNDQIWYWKEIGTLIAAIGFVLFLIGLGKQLLRSRYFSALKESPEPAKGLKGIGWWIGAVLTVFIPVLTYYTFINLPTKLKWVATAFWPQNITTTVVFWAIGNGLIFLALFLIWHFFLGGRKAGGNFSTYGLTWTNKLEWLKIGKSFLLAAAIGFGGYILLGLVDFFFKTDFRFYVFAVKLMTPLQFQIFLCYLVPFILFFGISGMALMGQMRLAGKNGKDLPLWQAILINIGLVTLGFVFFLFYQYLPLYGGGVQADAATPNGPLYAIVSYQFIPLLGIAAAISTYFFRKTGHIYVGAFLNGIIITWIIVAGTATHYAFL
ncbi:MAG TPA: alpha/beta hydrolase [Anaerolineaceae bacterium]